MHILWDGVSDEHDDAAGVGAAADRCGFSGAYVHCVGADCTVPQGVREEELPERQVGAIPDQGRGNLPDPGECLAVFFFLCFCKCSRGQF